MLKQIVKRAAALCIAGALVLGSAVFPKVKAQDLQTEVEVSAQSAVLMTADTGTVLYEKDAFSQRPMASTTKIMTALLTLEEGERLGDPVIQITKEMVAVEGSSMGLQEGDEISLSNLAAGMLLASGNDAANAAAIYLAGSLEGFVELMNQRAVEIGMEHTHFVTPSGLDGESADGRGHYSTAYDMALLAREALQNEQFRELCSSASYVVDFAQPVKRVTYTNHNKLLSQYEGCVGVKTGYTKQAGRCLVSAAERDGALLIAVTLDAPDDWKDHTVMLDYGFSQVEPYSLDGTAVSGTVPVVGSEQDSVSFSGSQGNTISLPLGESAHVTSQVYLPAFVYAPVKAGDKVGEIRWYWDGKLLGTVSLIAKQSAQIQTKEPGVWAKLFGNGS